MAPVTMTLVHDPERYSHEALLPRAKGISGRAYSFFSCGAKSIPKKLLSEIFFYIVYRSVEFPLQSASGFPYKSAQNLPRLAAQRHHCHEMPPGEMPRWKDPLVAAASNDEARPIHCRPNVKG